jgi:hypothetical protein
MNPLHILTALLTGALACPAAAQTIANVKVEPATAKPGEAVTVTAEFDNAANPNCNVRVHFGDGQSKDFKINQAKDLPLVARHSYAKAGKYNVRVEGKTALPTLKCVGATRSAALTVAAPPPPPPAVAAGQPACPTGFALDVKSMNKKTGAFTCSAKAGTALPAARLACPGTLNHFENKARAQVGCRP